MDCCKWLKYTKICLYIVLIYLSAELIVVYKQKTYLLYWIHEVLFTDVIFNNPDNIKKLNDYKFDKDIWKEDIYGRVD